MGSPYFTDRRGGNAHGAYPAQDSWPPVRGQAATGTPSSRRPPAPPVPPPGEFDLTSGPPSTPGAIRRVERVAAGEQEYGAPSDPGHFQPDYDYDYGADPGHEGYQDRYRPTGGSPRFGDPAYSAYDDYSVPEDQLASRSWAATSAARGLGGSGRAAAEHTSATDTRFGAGRPAGGSRPGGGSRPAAGGRVQADRAQRPDGAARAPGAHRAPVGRPGSARARLAIASTASLAGLSALVGTAAMATDTGPLTIKPGPGGTATGQWPTSESTDVAAAGGGTMDDGPHLTPVAPSGTTSGRQTPAPTPAEAEPPATLADLTGGGMIYGDGGYVNAAGPLSPTTPSADPNADAATAAAAAAPPSSSTSGQGTTGTTSGTLNDWLGIGGLGLGDILGTGTPSTPSSPVPSTSPDDPSTSPDPSGSSSPASSSSPSGSATTPSGQDSATAPASSGSGSTPHASAAPSPSAAPTSATASARYTADPFVVTNADPASNRAIVGRFV